MTFLIADSNILTQQGEINSKVAIATLSAQTQTSYLLHDVQGRRFGGIM